MEKQELKTNIPKNQSLKDYLENIKRTIPNRKRSSHRK